MDVFELYKPFRNKVALLSSDDALRVIWAYSQYLQIDDFQIPNDIKVPERYLQLQIPQKWISEWELELLAKEVILNGGTVPSKGRTLRSWKTLSELINQLKHLENEIYGLYGSSHNILIELNRIAHRQFIWQGNRPNSVATIRHFKIFNQHTINQICLDRLGLTVEDIYLCGIAFIGHFLLHPAMNLPLQSTIKKLSKDKIQQFLSFTCRTVSEMKSLLKSEQQYNDKFAYAYSSLRAFPLLRMRFQGNDAIACPLPTLLFWRITGGLYYELVGDERFSQSFGESFQGYVGEVIKRSCLGDRLHFLPEQEYGPKKARKRSVDWIVRGDGPALFVECKAKRLSWDAKTVMEVVGPLEADINHVANGVVQIYKTINDYIDDQYPHFSFVANRKIYPVFVTLENWHILGSAMVDMVHNAVTAKLVASKISTDVLNEMPYSIWAIEELEVGLQVMNSVGIHDFMVGKLDNAEFRRWEWRAYMRERFPEHLPAKKLFADEYEKIFSGLDG